MNRTSYLTDYLKVRL